MWPLLNSLRFRSATGLVTGQWSVWSAESSSLRMRNISFSVWFSPDVDGEEGGGWTKYLTYFICGSKRGWKIRIKNDDIYKRFLGSEPRASIGALVSGEALRGFTKSRMFFCGLGVCSGANVSRCTEKSVHNVHNVWANQVDQLEHSNQSYFWPPNWHSSRADCERADCRRRTSATFPEFKFCFQFKAALREIQSERVSRNPSNR